MSELERSDPGSGEPTRHGPGRGQPWRSSGIEGRAGGPGITLMLGGDVMVGRGIDQVLPHPSAPHLYEPHMDSALEYVALAERAHGRIPRPVDHEYVWGEALEVLDAVRPDVRIVNLETSVTTSEEAEPKGINYRMHPANVPVLLAARLDCCVLANNHVLDWGKEGLAETLGTLWRVGIATAGAGRDLRSARAPAVLEVAGRGRVVVFGFGAPDSGIPPHWAAGVGEPGVNLLPDYSDGTTDAVAGMVEAVKRPGDIVVASIHWGGNWGYEIAAEHRNFARALIEHAGVDVVHGHSSHHPKAIEVYRDRPILYGCGDLLNDYEGIQGREEYRGDLVLVYVPTLDGRTGRLVHFEMAPFQLRKFRLVRPSTTDLAWLCGTLDRECQRFGHRVTLRGETLVLEW